MSIELHVRPEQVPLSWDEFVTNYEPGSIALDGYVRGGPRFDAVAGVANFNHHEEVDRLATRATCAQVLMAIRQGLFTVFREVGVPTAHVLVNDCDEDVCTSWFLLKNHAMAIQATNPILNRLVAMEDALDATAGAYPFPQDLPALRELAWVFEPYRQFRLSGGLDRRDAGQYRSIIEDVYGRIERHVVGRGGEVALDTRYERIGGGAGWAMVREIGAQARTGMFGDGVHAYVSVRQRPDGRYTYVLGRMSQFIPFDLPNLFARLNEHEHCVDSADRWGGSDTVGGSPRVGGSGLGPDEVERIVREHHTMKIVQRQGPVVINGRGVGAARKS